MMHNLTASRILIALGFLVPVAFAENAGAQIGPYGSTYGGGFGALAYGASVSKANTQSRIAAQRHSQAQSRAINQNMVVQQGIRSTLAGSAQSRTQASRSEQQGARDWWFQHQLQASRTPRTPVYAPAPVAPRGAPESVPVSASQSPDAKGSAGVINWPQVLRNSHFAEQRARVEAVYRDKTPGAGPTAKDYLEMVDAATQMSAILKTMSRSIPPISYQETENFLYHLSAEARGRAKQKDAPPPTAEPAKKAATPGKQSE